MKTRLTALSPRDPRSNNSLSYIVENKSTKLVTVTEDRNSITEGSRTPKQKIADKID